eukprot:2834464-Pleurochrysis_carterae.AAC.1
MSADFSNLASTNLAKATVQRPSPSGRELQKLRSGSMTRAYFDCLSLCAQELHELAHRTERLYSKNFWFRGESYPAQVTAINIDAPTQHQSDCPFQRRNVRDVVKSLDGRRKWQSKVTGAM